MPSNKKFEKPTLYHKGKTGAIVQWDIWTVGDTIFVRHGQVGGKLQLSPKKAKAKNVGRANATTPEQQAIIEAEAMWKNKRDRKYSETPEQAEEILYLPMLAADYKKKKGKGIKFPADGQPKLDGVRATAFWHGDSIYLATRSGQEWKAPSHIARELEGYLPKEMVLDGEFYLHGVDFESISSWTKKVHPETASLEFHVFDMPLDEDGNNWTWKRRKVLVADFFKDYADKIKMLRPVPVVTLKSHQEVLAYEDECLAKGFEGCMVRNLDAEYLFDHRSNDIQKVKSTVDEEWKIVGFTEGDGRDAGCVIWKCVTKDGLPFDVRPKATLAKRAVWFKEGNKHIGEWLKVRYNNLTLTGKPRFPRSVGFRDEKDMSKKHGK